MPNAAAFHDSSAIKKSLRDLRSYLSAIHRHDHGPYLPLLSTQTEQANYTSEDSGQYFHTVDNYREYLAVALDDTKPDILSACFALDTTRDRPVLTHELVQRALESLKSHPRPQEHPNTQLTGAAYLSGSQKLRDDLKKELYSLGVSPGEFEILSVIDPKRRGPEIQSTSQEVKGWDRFSNEAKYQQSHPGSQTRFWLAGFSGYTECSADGFVSSVCTDLERKRHGFHYMSNGNKKAQEEIDQIGSSEMLTIVDVTETGSNAHSIRPAQEQDVQDRGR